MSGAEIIRLHERPTFSMLRRARAMATEALAKPAWNDDRPILNNLAAVLSRLDLAAFLATGVRLPRTDGEIQELLADDTRATWPFACLYRDIEKIMFASLDYDYNARRVGAQKAAQTRKRKRAALRGE